MTTTNDYIDRAILAVIDGETDKALGLLMRARLSYDADIDRQIVADANAVKSRLEREPAFQDDLPPIKPIKDKELKPIDFKCPTCNAKPGKPCVKVSTRGKEAKDGPKAIGEPLEAGKRHSARRLLWNQSRGLA